MISFLIVISNSDILALNANVVMLKLMANVLMDVRCSIRLNSDYLLAFVLFIYLFI